MATIKIKPTLHLLSLILLLFLTSCFSTEVYDFYPTKLGEPYLIGADTCKAIYALGADYAKLYAGDGFHVFAWKGTNMFEPEQKIWIVAKDNIIVDYGFDNNPRYGKQTKEITYPELIISSIGDDYMICNGKKFYLTDCSIKDLVKVIGKYSRVEKERIYIWDDIGFTAKRALRDSSKIVKIEIFFTSSFRFHEVIDDEDWLIKSTRVIAKALGDKKMKTGKEFPEIVPMRHHYIENLQTTPKCYYKNKIKFDHIELGIGCNFSKDSGPWFYTDPGHGDPGIVGRLLGDGPSPPRKGSFKMGIGPIIYFLKMLDDEENPYKEVQQIKMWNEELNF